MIKKRISWAICMIWSTTIYAQDFTHQASIEPIFANGFHKIVLSPELLGKANTSLSDLRIYDNDGIEQPYLIQRESSISTKSSFKEYKIVGREGENDSTSYLVFLNDDDQPIDQVSFIVQNTDVKKRASLSGSNDGKTWYVIRNNYLLQSMHSSNETTELKTIDFPLSDFSFFKLQIENNIKEPINILKVGYYERQKTAGLSTNFDYPVLSQTDSANTSFVRLDLPEMKYLEKLRFEVSGAQYYSRHMRILIKKEAENKRMEKVYHLQQIGSLELNSNGNNEIEIGGIRLQALFIEIDNKDNLPLKLERVIGSFLNHYAVVDLKTDKSYLLKFGNQELRAPNYDIAYFGDVIPEHAPKTNIKQIKILTNTEEAMVEEPSIFNNPIVLWGVIGIVGIFLAFISFRMIKELGQRE
ncbi:MAG: hypothetical protein OCD76_19560 [Reichenbachiella sp.]